MQLAVRVGDDDLETARAALDARGATYLHTASQGPHPWITMTDPERDESCVSR